jgi:pyrimidine oxygenase
LELGVFIPIGNNGWLISGTSPQYKPSFELNKKVVQTAERHGLDFVLSMIKLRGFGGPTEFWDYNLESFTLMAGLAAVTSRIRLFATVPTLAVPPAIAARMAVTIDSISHGRFGLNIITGWQRPEYSQMGIWPGDAYFARRYDYAAEYVRIMRELWETGVSDFRGEFFQMDDCRLLPKPSVPMKLICAGQSAAGMAFTARWADHNFCLGIGFNTPAACAPTVARMQEAAAETGRPVSCYALFMVIIAETDAEALAKWEHYREGVDTEAVAWMMQQGAADTRPNADTNVRQLTDAMQAVNLNIGVLVGSYGHVAAMLDELADIPGLAGVLLTFDEFVGGTEIFGTRVQPLMRSRRHIAPALEATA